MSEALDLVRIIKYPFLIKEPIKFLSERNYIPPNISLWEATEILGASDRVKELILQAVKNGSYYHDEKELVREVIAFHSALIILAYLRNLWLTKRFAISVAKTVSPELYMLSDKALRRFAGLLKLDLKGHEGPDKLKILIQRTPRGPIERIYNLSIRMDHYLQNTMRLKGNPKWKITNQLLKEGRVFLERKRAIRLIEERIAYQIEVMVKRYEEAVKPGAKLPHPFSSIAEEIQELLAREIPRIRLGEKTEGWKGPIIYEAFPPCMKRILENAKSGSNLSHHERFAIATFMIQLGASEDEVIEIFRSLPDYNEKITRYQVEHLMGTKGGGKKYLPYNCDTMKTLGLCIAECNVSTPFQKYIKNRKEFKRNRERDKNEAENNSP